MTTITTTDQNNNLPATTTDNLPAAAAAPVESLEFSASAMNELIAAIDHAGTLKPAEMEAVRVDATYFDTADMKKGDFFIRMIAGYSWRKSDFGEGEVPSINFYDVEKKEFQYAMQTALVGKCREAKLPRGQMVKITYLGKTKGKKYSYEDWEVAALVPKKKEPETETKTGK